MAPPDKSGYAYGVDAKGKYVLQRTLARSGVIRFFANLPECLVEMEACSSSEYWAGKSKAWDILCVVSIRAM